MTPSTIPRCFLFRVVTPIFSRVRRQLRRRASSNSKSLCSARITLRDTVIDVDRADRCASRCPELGTSDSESRTPRARSTEARRQCAAARRVHPRFPLDPRRRSRPRAFRRRRRCFFSHTGKPECTRDHLYAKRL